MKSKTKNNKLPKSDKTRLSDLSPKNDARAGAGQIPGTGPAPMPDTKKNLIKYPPPSA